MIRDRTSRRCGLLVLAALLALAACRRHAPAPTIHAPCASAAAAIAPATLAPDPLDVAAARSRRAARLAEPATTARLQAIASRERGELVGLEHRLKTFASTRRKIAAAVAKRGGEPADVEVYDGLRYTLQVPDDPPGHHEEVVRATLAELEAAGHQVEKVKNYWPAGDSYSGTNCRLRSPDGPMWELQFHTPLSWISKSRTHEDYETMRAKETTLEAKRALFRRMTAVWEAVPIPEGILEGEPLHAKEERATIPAP